MPVMAETPPPTPETAGGDALTPSILVVDDSRFFRELISDLLHPLGVEIHFAGSAEEPWTWRFSGDPGWP